MLLTIFNKSIYTILLSENSSGFLLGEIVYKTLIRFLLTVVLLWIAKDFFDQKYFWIVSILALYFFTFYPAYSSYKKFIEKNKSTVDNSLCTTCKHFDKSAVLCTKYDKHPEENFIPCDGNDWEPK